MRKIQLDKHNVGLIVRAEMRAGRNFKLIAHVQDADFEVETGLVPDELSDATDRKVVAAGIITFCERVGGYHLQPVHEGLVTTWVRA
jgi:hypothetical protein